MVGFPGRVYCCRSRTGLGENHIQTHQSPGTLCQQRLSDRVFLDFTNPSPASISHVTLDFYKTVMGRLIIAEAVVSFVVEGFGVQTLALLLTPQLSN